MRRKNNRHELQARSSAASHRHQGSLVWPTCRSTSPDYSHKVPQGAHVTKFGSNRRTVTPLALYITSAGNHKRQAASTRLRGTTLQWLAAPQAAAPEAQGTAPAAILQETTIAGVLQCCCRSAAVLAGYCIPRGCCNTAARASLLCRELRCCYDAAATVPLRARNSMPTLSHNSSSAEAVPMPTTTHDKRSQSTLPR
jgi:hypothetical protein